MMENTKDNSSFRELMADVRETKGKSLRTIGLGLYSPTMIKRVETGERMPKKLERDRILARLGISGEEYEDYLSQDEYAEWLMRQDILKSIEAKDIAESEKKIAAFEALGDDGKVEGQFLEAMRFMLLQLKKAPEEELRSTIERAVSYTIPYIDEGFPKRISLADQEINLLLEYVRLHLYGETEEERHKWRIKIYNDIIKYLKETDMDDICKAKIYPKLVYYISLEYQDGKCPAEELKRGLELCSYAVECLRDAKRLYYMVELLELRQWLIAQILEKSADISEAEVRKLRTLANTSKKWETLFKELYAEYGVSPYMENFCFLYWETESHSSNEVIRLRRKMLNVTQEAFCDGVCTTKTIGRIENKEMSPQMFDLCGLFEKSSLFPDYVRSRAISADWEVLKLRNEIVQYNNDRNVKKWSESLTRLESRLDMDVLQNKQLIMHERIILEESIGKITRQEAVERLIKVANMTVPVDKLLNLEEWFLTREEMVCIYSIAIRIGLNEENKYMDILRGYCKRGIRESSISVRLGVYELLLAGIANYLGNIKAYEESTAMANYAIRLSLENRRMYSLARNLYSICWNKYNIDGVKTLARDIPDVDITLHRCLLLSEIARDKKMNGFFKEKLKD